MINAPLPNSANLQGVLMRSILPDARVCNDSTTFRYTWRMLNQCFKMTTNELRFAKYVIDDADGLIYEETYLSPTCDNPRSSRRNFTGSPENFAALPSFFVGLTLSFAH